MAIDRFPVEASHILMFARSVGDPNPIYTTPTPQTEAGGIIAPPTFAQASAQFDPDYFLRPKVGEPWFGSGKEPTGDQARRGRSGGGGGGGGGGGLHAEQHFAYHRHLRPGDVLTGTVKPGKTWEKEGKRSGKLVFTESDHRVPRPERRAGRHRPRRRRAHRARRRGAEEATMALKKQAS